MERTCERMGYKHRFTKFLRDHPINCNSYNKYELTIWTVNFHNHIRFKNGKTLRTVNQVIEEFTGDENACQSNKCATGDEIEEYQMDKRVNAPSRRNTNVVVRSRRRYVY